MIPAAMRAAMCAAAWPGNIRELQNAVLRFLATGEGLGENQSKESDGEPLLVPACLDLAACRAHAAEQCLRAALAQSKGSKTKAAALLKMNMRTFHRYCAKYKH